MAVWKQVNLPGGGGGGVFGGSTSLDIRDAVGSITANVTMAEPNAALSDASIAALSVSMAEQIVAQVEAMKITLATVGDTNAIHTETNLSSITSTSAETSAALTHAETAAITAASSETNAAVTETNLSALTTTGTETKAAFTETNQANVTATTAETKAAFTETNLSNVTASRAETITASETNLANLTNIIAETNAAHTDADTSTLRCWSSSTVTNDSSGAGAIVAANANGQPDAAVAIVKTNNSLGNLTNPVTITSTIGGIPSTGAFTAKRLRVHFSIPAAPTLDTLILQYKLSAGSPVTFYTDTDVAVDNLATGLTFDVSGITLANLAGLQLIASYTASVVASPQTTLRIDAWCLELDGVIA